MHVPFADSKLTLLLKDVLLGGARMTFLICASLETRNAVESIQALRFGESCSRVETRSGGQAGAGAAALRKLVAEIDQEIAEVQAVIVRDQRWEKRVTVGATTAALNRGPLVHAEHPERVSQRTAQCDIARVRHPTRVAQVRRDVIALKDNFSSEVTHDGVEDYTQGILVVGADDGKGSTETIAHEVESNVLVGAEEAEARLEALLNRKRALLGE